MRCLSRLICWHLSQAQSMNFPYSCSNGLCNRVSTSSASRRAALRASCWMRRVNSTRQPGACDSRVGVSSASAIHSSAVFCFSDSILGQSSLIALTLASLQSSPLRGANQHRSPSARTQYSTLRQFVLSPQSAALGVGLPATPNLPPSLLCSCSSPHS